MPKSKPIIFIMDPLETVQPKKDTTYQLMKAAAHFNIPSYAVMRHQLTLDQGRVIFNATHVVPNDNETFPFDIIETVTISALDCLAIFIRLDPPFDTDYITITWLLDSIASFVPVINSPNGLRQAHEKLWATQFSELVPPTRVTTSFSDATSFLNQHKTIILKPLHSFGGQGILKLSENDSNAAVLFDYVTNNRTSPCILQAYVPEATKGDKRIILLNGEILGAVLRVHSKSDHRNNFMAGGHAEPTEITKRDLDIVTAIKPALMDLGLYFVGIDIIGNFLIEVNVTSPTCLQEMIHFDQKPLDHQVIEFVLTLKQQCQSRV